MWIRPSVLATILTPCLLIAEDSQEVFTLHDGRTLSGRYDAGIGVLHLAGPIPATMPLAAEAIAGRRAATDADLPQALGTVDPATTAERRLAYLRTGVRSLDRIRDQRAGQLAAVERRIAAGMAALRDAEHAKRSDEDALRDAKAELDRTLTLLDEIEQARALAETRLTAIATRSDCEQPCRESLDIYRELGHADARIRDLRARKTADAWTVSTTQTAVAAAVAACDRLAEDLAKDEARLARYRKADADDVAKRESLLISIRELEAATDTNADPRDP